MDTEKTIGLLIEDQEDLVVEGNDSLFMMHGNIMALAVIRSKTSNCATLPGTLLCPPLLK